MQADLAHWLRCNKPSCLDPDVHLRRFTAWLGNNASQGKQRRLLGELHTRMTSSGHIAADRLGLRTAYLPTMRFTLTKPLATLGKEGIPEVIDTMAVGFCSSVVRHAFWASKQRTTSPHEAFSAMVCHLCAGTGSSGCQLCEPVLMAAAMCAGVLPIKG